jgi:hypothetical protein
VAHSHFDNFQYKLLNYMFEVISSTVLPSSYTRHLVVVFTSDGLKYHPWFLVPYL